MEKTTPIPINKMPAVLEEITGIRTSIQTIYRWNIKGLHGVKLNFCYVQGKPHLTLELMDKFNAEVTEVMNSRPTIPMSGTRKTTAKHAAKAHERAKRRLAKENDEDSSSGKQVAVAHAKAKQRLSK